MHLPHGGLIERATDGVAILAVVSWLNPGFYQWLSDFSQLAALMLPILGCLWLGVQITSRVVKGK